VRLCPVDQAQARLQLAALEAAGAGQQAPGRGQVLLDELCLAPGLPGDRGPAGKHQSEQQQDQQTAHEAPLRRSDRR
jgi:hypothetical protein